MPKSDTSRALQPMLEVSYRIFGEIGLARDSGPSNRTIDCDPLWKLIESIETGLKNGIEEEAARQTDAQRWRQADLRMIQAAGGFTAPQMALLLSLLIEQHGDRIISDAGISYISEAIQRRRTI